jgi:hypothetical protein
MSYSAKKTRRIRITKRVKTIKEVKRQGETLG